jgi:hypothetical protein
VIGTASRGSILLAAGVAFAASARQTTAPAPSSRHVAIVVETQLVDASVRTGIRELAMRLQPAAAVGLFAIGNRTTTLVDYTMDINTVAAAADRLGAVVQLESNLGESLLDVVQAIGRRRLVHPAIVIVASIDGSDIGPSASDVAGRIKRSGAVLYAVGVVKARGRSEDIPAVSGAPDRILMTPVRRQDVLTRAAKASGGSYTEVKSTGGAANAMLAIAEEILRQAPRQ